MENVPLPFDVIRISHRATGYCFLLAQLLGISCICALLFKIENYIYRNSLDRNSAYCNRNTGFKSQRQFHLGALLFIIYPYASPWGILQPIAYRTTGYRLQGALKSIYRCPALRPILHPSEWIFSPPSPSTNYFSSVPSPLPWLGTDSSSLSAVMAACATGVHFTTCPQMFSYVLKRR